VAPNTHRARQVVVPESLPLLQPAHDAIAAAVAPLANTPATRLSSYEAAAPKDAAVAGITLNATLTAALNQNGQPGDDGLMVVVEPRNRAGELIPPAGSLSVSLLDPAATSEEEARVGRWDYSAEQTKQLYRRTTLGDGVQLNLLWQKGPPRHDRLELYVRLAMADGRKLHARRTILVTLPAATAVAEEPRRLEPEPVMPEPVLPLPKPVAAPTRPAPVPADPFQVIPLAPAPVAAAGVGPPTPIVAQPAIVQPPIPVAPAVPAVQPATRVAAVPRRPQPVRPPAEEQVAIPREPGDAPEPLTEPSVAPPPPKPQWAPFRD
jgi:hypothetical protein